MAPSTLKLKYNTASNKLQSTLGLWLDDVKLKVQFTEKTLKEGAVKEDVEIGVERPGHFILEHHLHKRHTRFQFHSHADVAKKPVKLTFTHHILPNPVTTLEASSVLDDKHKLTVKHNFAKAGPIVKLEHHFKGLSVEPQLDFGAGSKEGWGLSLRHGHAKKDFAKATYIHHKREAELELHKKIDDGGPLKVTATFDVNNLKSVPKFVIEKEFRV